eukprot:1355090-Amphidinium_carterae.1
MLGKRCRTIPFGEGVNHGKRLRANLEDLSASNLISAERFGNLLNDAFGAGVTECYSRVALTHTRMRHDAFMLELLKGSGWPSLRHFKVPMVDKTVQEPLAFLLPHELLHKLVESSGIEPLVEFGGLDESSTTEALRLATEWSQGFIPV